MLIDLLQEVGHAGIVQRPGGKATSDCPHCCIDVLTV